MKGLLLKDGYTLLRQSRIFLLMIALFAVLPGYSMTGFAIVYAAMLPYTALAYDERSKWDVYAAMMPYTRMQLVLSKYILGWITVGGALLLSAAAKLVSGMMSGDVDVEQMLSLPAVAGTALLILAISLPLMFYWGVEKGRMVFLLFVVLCAVSVTGLAAGLVQAGDTLGLALAVGLPVAGVAAQFLSVPLAARLYSTAHEG